MTFPSDLTSGRVNLIMVLTLVVARQASAGSCTVSTPGMAFGPYQPLTFAGKLYSVDKTSNATINVVCTGIDSGGAYTIALGPTTVGAGDRISTRYLANDRGGDNMAFNIYREPSFLTVWGDGVGVGGVLGGSIPTGNSNLSHTVYGRIPAGQNFLRAGTFSGSMTMTLTYNP